MNAVKKRMLMGVKSARSDTGDEPRLAYLTEGTVDLRLVPVSAS